MADFTDTVSIELQQSTKQTSTGIAKVVNDLKQLHNGMTVGMTGVRDLQKQFQELGVSLSNSKLKSSISSINSDILRYVTTSGQMVIVNRKVKNGLDSYRVSLKNTNKELKNGTSLWSAFTQGVSGALVKMQILYNNISRLVNKTVDMIQGATAYEEALNLFTVSMGAQAEDAMKWVEHFSEALYLDPSNVMQYMGSLNSLIGGLGVGAEKSYLMSKNLTQLAYDLASFKNMKFEEAFTKLQSGISGEIEPLRNVGVALSQNTLQELANSLGIKQRVAEMSEAQKAQLRYVQILKSTTQWQGDMGRTLISPANALRVVKEQFSLLGRAIGSVFIPMVMKAIPYVMALTEILTDLANRLAAFFGYELTSIDYSSLGNVEIGIKDIGDAAEDTTNKLNTMLAPFDELNVVQNQSKSNGAGSILGGDLGLDLPQYDALAGLTDEFKNNVEAAKENLEKILKVAGALATIMGSIWVVNKLLKFNDGLLTLLDITGDGTKKFTGLSKVVNNVVKNFATGYKNSKSLAGGLKNVWKNTSTLSKGLLGTTGLVVGTVSAYNSMKNLGNQTKGTGAQLGKFALSTGSAVAGGAALGSIIPGVGTAIGALAGGLIGAVGGIIGLSDGMKELKMQLAEESVFGDLTISTQSFKTMLEGMGTVVSSSREQINAFTNSLNETKASFDSGLESVDNYLYRFTIMGDKISGEDGENFKLALQTLFDDANTIINTSAQQAELIVIDTLKNTKILTEEEQKTILASLESNGEYTKTKVQDIQDKIYDIYNNAIKERGYLTADEKRQIQELLDEINKLTNRSVSQTYTDLKLSQENFNSDSLELAKESYANFEIARQEYEKEQEEAAKKAYNEAYTLAETNAETSLDQLKEHNQELKDEIDSLWEFKQIGDEKSYNQGLESLRKNNKDVATELEGIMTIRENMQNTANEKYLQAQERYKEISNTALTNIQKEIGTKYTELLESNEKDAKYQRKVIESIFKDLKWDLSPFETAGKDARKKFQNSFGTGTLSYDTKGKVNYSFQSTFGYAEGGFPKTGEFFLAREAGPEMVGKIGNQTAVANNDQITTSITNALITALNSYGFGDNKPSTTIVNIGGKKVYEGVGDYVDSENDRYGTNYVHV